jgi:hypothetical protein
MLENDMPYKYHIINPVLSIKLSNFSEGHQTEYEEFNQRIKPCMRRRGKTVIAMNKMSSWN